MGDNQKGKCQRKDPPCKYLHPPQHLREQLLQNGRNNLILKNLQMHAVAQATLQPLVPGSMVPIAGGKPMTYPTILPGQYPVVAHPYLGTVPTSAVALNPYLNAAVPTVALPGGSSEAQLVQPPPVPSVVQTPIPTATQQKIQRADRLEVCREFQRGTCTRQPSDCRYAHPPDNVTVDTSDNHVTVCMDFIKGKCTRDSCRYYHPPPHLQAQIKAAQQRANAVAAQAQALPQMVEVLTAKKRPRDPADDLVLQSAVPAAFPAYKRMAIADNKSGIPVYQPGTNVANMAAYQQAALAMQLQQTPYIPVTYSMVLTPNEVTVTPPPAVASPMRPIPTNAASINYTDANKQLLDTLPVCHDFKKGLCNRPQCKFVHLLEDYVEVINGKVQVCRDAVRGKCSRPTCKYYHLPIELPPAE